MRRKKGEGSQQREGENGKEEDRPDKSRGIKLSERKETHRERQSTARETERWKGADAERKESDSEGSEGSLSLAVLPLRFFSGLEFS